MYYIKYSIQSSREKIASMHADNETPAPHIMDNMEAAQDDMHPDHAYMSGTPHQAPFAQHPAFAEDEQVQFDSAPENPPDLDPHGQAPHYNMQEEYAYDDHDGDGYVRLV